jgi:hypothetical protein
MDGNRRYNAIVTILAWLLLVCWIVMAVHEHPLGR